MIWSSWWGYLGLPRTSWGTRWLREPGVHVPIQLSCHVGGRHSLALWVSVRTTDLLCSSGWCELKLRYWSVHVAFLYTVVLVPPSSMMCIHRSKNGSFDSTSGSMVNCILGSMLLMWAVKPSTAYSCILTNVSSTYRSQVVA